MEQLKNTAELIGLKDKNIKIKTVFKADTHITIEASLDYQPPLCPHCKSQMSKYDFQRASTIPILDVQGMPTVLKLKKRRFQCKGYRRVTVSETSLVKKHCQISKPVRQKITQYHTEKLTNTAIAKRLHLSVSLVQRQLEATNKLIKDIKRQAFGFLNFKNFKTKILIALNIKIERTNLILSRC